MLTPAIIWDLFAKKSADRPNCHYSSVTFSSPTYSDNLKTQFVIIWVAPLIKARPFGLFPVHALGCQVLFGQSEPQLENYIRNY